MPIGPARMSLLDHIGELRMRLVRIVVCLIVAACVFYLATPTVAQFLLQPVSEFMPKDDAGRVMLNVFGAFDAFQVRFTLSLWCAAVATAPVILWQLIAFFLPALKPRERKWFVPTFAVAVALFLFGVVFCYLVILHPAFEFLTDQASGFATVMPEADRWIDIILKFELGFGCAFELPLLVFYLVIFNIVPYKKLRASWRIVYVVLLTFSAVITPDASPVTMMLMFAAMVSLYELSLLAARIGLKRRIKRQEEQRKQDELDRAEAKQEFARMKKAAQRHFWGDGVEEAADSNGAEPSATGRGGKE